jgi:hypothetical protein
MNLIVFNTLVGAPISMLLLSTPVAPQRSCVFTVHPQITTEVFKSREGQVLLPDRPTEYPCNYARGRKETVVEFTNQNGWHFVAKIGPGNEGTWAATKDAQTLNRTTLAPFGD